MPEFEGLEYTRTALVEELALIERHARDGSAIDGGCACIQEKHLINVAGLASEGVTLATDPREKDYYFRLAEEARQRRKEILNAEWGHEGHILPSCEEKILDCIAKGSSEEQCRSEIKCKG